MTFLTKSLAPSIHLYENVIDFSKNISDLSIANPNKWNINNYDPAEWEPGKRVVGYDEYEINFNFLEDEHFLILGKKIFDSVLHYSVKNLTTINNLESCVIRKYSSTPGFLQLESSDSENSSRKLTAVLFLNDIDQGGQLTFKNFDVSISPRQGSMVIFPASFAYSFKINKPKELDSLVIVSHFV